MSFIRAFVGKVSGEVKHVLETTAPFRDDGPIVREVNDRGEPVGEELEVVDYGWIEPLAEYRTLDGKACSPARHVFDRVKGRRAPNRDELSAGSRDLPRFHDCPCTLNGLRARLRQRGPEGIPMKVRAWLANVLSPDEVSAMGIARGIPISAVKAAEGLRLKRDPGAGSRMLVLERKTQEQADGLAKARLEKRKRQAARAEQKRVERERARAERDARPGHERGSKEKEA